VRLVSRKSCLDEKSVKHKELKVFIEVFEDKMFYLDFYLKTLLISKSL